MATIKLANLRINEAASFISNFNNNDYYLFVGRPQEWIDSSNQSISDSNPPLPNNSIEFYNSVYYDMISLKKISPNQVRHVVPRVTWESNSVYDMYRHDYSFNNLSASGSSELESSRFFVVNSQNDVYACLYNLTTPDNSNGLPSTVEPIGQNESVFYTSDGYQWKYLYTLSGSDINNYSTNKYIPIGEYDYTPVAGSIHTVVINNRGGEYTSNPAGVSNILPYYYCPISGDGSGAVARVSVLNGEISEIEVIREGYNYTYANLNFISGNVYKSLVDLDNRVNSLNPLGDSSFSSTVIISPPGGWGSNLISQLYASKVGIFVNLDLDDSDFVYDISFRQIGILANVEYTDDAFEDNETLSPHYALKLDGGSYQVLEEITQEFNGNIARGTVIGWDSTSNILRYIQNPEIHSDADGNLYQFSNNSEVVGMSSSSSGLVISFDGADGGRLFDNGVSPPEIVKFSGDIIYLSNRTPITRDPLQVEKISIILVY